jgi:hypothetical protein
MQKILVRGDELDQVRKILEAELGDLADSAQRIDRIMSMFDVKPAIPARKLTRDEVLSDRSPRLTVGDLKRHIEENVIPDSAPVLIERVEDLYYERSNWGVLLKQGFHYNQVIKANERMKQEIERRARGEEPHFEIEDPAKFILENQDLLDEFQGQYTPAWSCVKYRDEDSILFIDLHY